MLALGSISPHVLHDAAWCLGGVILGWVSAVIVLFVGRVSAELCDGPQVPR